MNDKDKDWINLVGLAVSVTLGLFIWALFFWTILKWLK